MPMVAPVEEGRALPYDGVLQQLIPLARHTRQQRHGVAIEEGEDDREDVVPEQVVHATPPALDAPTHQHHPRQPPSSQSPSHPQAELSRERGRGELERRVSRCRRRRRRACARRGRPSTV